MDVHVAGLPVGAERDAEVRKANTV